MDPRTAPTVTGEHPKASEDVRKLGRINEHKEGLAWLILRWQEDWKLDGLPEELEFYRLYVVPDHHTKLRAEWRIYIVSELGMSAVIAESVDGSALRLLGFVPEGHKVQLDELISQRT